MIYVLLFTFKTMLFVVQPRTLTQSVVFSVGAKPAVGGNGRLYHKRCTLTTHLLKRRKGEEWIRRHGARRHWRGLLKESNFLDKYLRSSKKLEWNLKYFEMRRREFGRVSTLALGISTKIGFNYFLCAIKPIIYLHCYLIKPFIWK